MKTAYPKRRAGLDAMNESLTPIARAIKRFGSGKPVTRPTDTPLTAVLLATEQRDRLRAILESEEGIESARVTHAAIAIRIHARGALIPIPDDPGVLIIEGSESRAVAELEAQLKCENTFTVSGLTFVVEVQSETRVFQYRLERTPEGDAALNLATERLLKGVHRG